MSVEQSGIVYSCVNIESGKVYIGITSKSLGNRISHHYRRARDKAETHFHKALMKYPKESFRWRQIDSGRFPDLYRMEQIYIDLFDTFNNGYNKSHGGEGSIGHSWSDAARKRMSEIKKGSPSAFKGRTHTEETRRKMAEAKKGKPGNNTGKRHSAESKQKMSESRYRYLSRIEKGE